MSIEPPTGSQSPSTSPQKASANLSAAHHWRTIFPRYAFQNSPSHSPRTFTLERPPGVPSVSTFDTSHPQTPVKPESAASNQGAHTSQTPQGPVHPLTRLVPPIYRTDEPEEVHKKRRFIYNAAIGVCIACPLIVIMPPRKLDLFTFGLGLTFFVSAGFVVEQRTGQGMLWHIGYRMTRLTKDGRDYQEEAARREAQMRLRSSEGGAVGNPGARETWIEERLRKEREALDEGKGYGSLIGDHIAEAMGFKKADDDDDDEEEEQDEETSMRSSSTKR